MPKEFPLPPEQIVKLFPRSPATFQLKGTTSLAFNDIENATMVFEALETSMLTTSVDLLRKDNAATVSAEFTLNMTADELLTWLATKPRTTKAENAALVKAAKAAAGLKPTP